MVRSKLDPLNFVPAQPANRLYPDKGYNREKAVLNRSDAEEDRYRDEFSRDYARLIHSPSFRRLQGKTQVFPPGESDFFRNRLTHSMEVAQIARSIAARFNYEHDFFKENPINLRLIELSALAHDLGHPPFGHNGEKALDDCMKSCGGFEGNAQTFHILTKVEKKEVKNNFPAPISRQKKDNRLGLNWCYRSLASIIKYDTLIPQYRSKEDKFKKGIFDYDKEIYEKTRRNTYPKILKKTVFKTIEASIMDIADDIAYSTYDLEDSLKSGFIFPLSILSIDGQLREKVAEKVKKSIDSDFTAADVGKILFDVFSKLQGDGSSATGKNKMIEAIKVQKASENLANNGYLRTDFTSDLVSEFVTGVELTFDDQNPIASYVTLSDRCLRKVECLKHFTYEATIMAPRLRVAEARGYDLVREIFEKLDETNGYLLMPDDFRELYEGFTDPSARKRVIADFIAGMTDRYAVEFYGRLISETPTTIFKPF